MRIHVSWMVAGLLWSCAAAPRAVDAQLEWKTYILPTSDELGHEALPWLPTFGEGMLAASEQQRPLLFWAMNGHPLGCT